MEVNPAISKQPLLIHGRSVPGPQGLLIHGGCLFMGFTKITHFCLISCVKMAKNGPGVAYSWGLLIHGCRVKISKKLLIHGGCL